MGLCDEATHDSSVASSSRKWLSFRKDSQRPKLSSLSRINVKITYTRDQISFLDMPFFRRKPSIWQDPQLSVGVLYGTIPKTNLKCWETVGPAFETYRQLKPRIYEILAQSQGPLPNSDILCFQVYMVGLTPETTVPHVMFASESKAQRKRAKNILERGGLLQSSQFNGIKAGEWAKPPHIGTQRQLGGSQMLASAPAENPIGQMHLYLRPKSPISMSNADMGTYSYSDCSVDGPSSIDTSNGVNCDYTESLPTSWSNNTVPSLSTNSYNSDFVSSYPFAQQTQPSVRFRTCGSPSFLQEPLRFRSPEKLGDARRSW
jgi:hypothetical protein